MFKLQLLTLERWINVNYDFLSLLPQDCDVLAYVRANWPASSWRIAYVKDSEPQPARLLTSCPRCQNEAVGLFLQNSQNDERVLWCSAGHVGVMQTGERFKLLHNFSKEPELLHEQITVRELVDQLSLRDRSKPVFASTESSEDWPVVGVSVLPDGVSIKFDMRSSNE